MGVTKHRASAIIELLVGTRRWGLSVREALAKQGNRSFETEPAVPFAQAAAFPVDRSTLVAIEEMETRGFEVRSYNSDGKLFYEINRVLLIEPDKMRQLGDEILRLIDTHGAFSEGILKLLAKQ